MKVLVISHMFPSSFDEIAGIFVYEQVKALVKKGLEIKVVSPVPWVPFPLPLLSAKWKKYKAIPKKEKNWEEISAWYPRYMTFPKSWFFASSGKRMYQGIQKNVVETYRDFKFDLIHAHTLMPDGFAGILLQKEIDVPLIVTAHGSDLLLYPHKNKKSFLHTLKVLKNASKIITVSSYLKDKCKDEFTTPDNKVEVIYDGYDDHIFHFSLDNSIQKKRNNGITILFVGHIVKAKGVFDLLSAIQIIDKTNKGLSKKLSWVIIGQGADMAEFKKELGKLNVDADIKVMGQIPHKEVSEFMRVSDFVILPSWSEGLSVVLLEAIACGLPVIATKVGGIPEIVHQDNGVLVDPRNPAMLAREILNALSKDWNRQLISENAKKYTWEKNTQKTLAVYQEVLDYER